MFNPKPESQTQAEFVSRFGGVYEHSPWIAEAVFQDGLSQDQNTVSGLHQKMASKVDEAPQQKRLALIVSHPDLAGRAAQRGELTEESTTEQASAGIDQCSAEEFERFQAFNTAYKNKFEFPFVMAVKGSNRHLILAAFEERLKNDYDTEFNRAIFEIHKIALFRLQDIADNNSN